MPGEDFHLSDQCALAGALSGASCLTPEGALRAPCCNKYYAAIGTDGRGYKEPDQ